MNDETISGLTFELNISAAHQDQITNFFESHGESGTLNILKKIRKTRAYQKRGGQRIDSAMFLWKQYAEQYVKSVAGRRRADMQAQEWAEARKAHERAKAKGYVPGRKTIKAQLDDLLDSGEISISDYEFGMVGLDCVHGMIGDAGIVIDMGPATIIESLQIVDDSGELVFGNTSKRGE